MIELSQLDEVLGEVGECRGDLALGVATLVIALTAGCGGGKSASPPPTSATKAPHTVFDAILDEAKPDGMVSVNTARQLFQYVFGGLHDVTLPAGTAATGPVDGTLALRWMTQDASELSPADAARVAQIEDLGGAVSATVSPGFTPPASLPPHGGRSVSATTAAPETLPPTLPPTDPEVKDFTQRIEYWLAKEEEDSGVAFEIPVDVEVRDAPDPESPGAIADELALNADGKTGQGAPARCLIQYWQKGIHESIDAQRDFVTAHELGHLDLVPEVVQPAGHGPVRPRLQRGRLLRHDRERRRADVPDFPGHAEERHQRRGLLRRVQCRAPLARHVGPDDVRGPGPRRLVELQRRHRAPAGPVGDSAVGGATGH